MPDTAAPLRRATPADLDTLAALEAQCFGADDGVFSRRQLRTLLRNPRSYWLMTADGRAMACWLRAGNGHRQWARLYSLAVHPALRGQGVAAQLLAAGEAWMRQHGLDCCRAEVKLENHAARRLYARAGFHERALLKDYYGAGHDGVRLERRLVIQANPRPAAPLTLNASR